MACAVPARVEVQRVTPVGTAQSDCQRVTLLGDGHNVYVVFHQAISQIRARAFWLLEPELSTRIFIRAGVPMLTGRGPKALARVELTV